MFRYFYFIVRKLMSLVIGNNKILPIIFFIVVFAHFRIFYRSVARKSRKEHEK